MVVTARVCCVVSGFFYFHPQRQDGTESSPPYVIYETPGTHPIILIKKYLCIFPLHVHRLNPDWWRTSAECGNHCTTGSSIHKPYLKFWLSLTSVRIHFGEIFQSGIHTCIHSCATISCWNSSFNQLYITGLNEQYIIGCTDLPGYIYSWLMLDQHRYLELGAILFNYVNHSPYLALLWALVTSLVLLMYTYLLDQDYSV